MTDSIPDEIISEARELARFAISGISFKSAEEIERQIEFAAPKPQKPPLLTATRRSRR